MPPFAYFLIGFFLASFATLIATSCLEVNRIADYEAEIQYLKMKLEKAREKGSAE